MHIRVAIADYRNPADAAAVLRLLDAYASDPMGGGTPLQPAARARLIDALASRYPHAFSLLAHAGAEAVGLANCFEGFSTFAAAPLVNIHDIFVVPAFRGVGVAQAMLGEAERIALDRGCCKLTLEVLDGNDRAKAAYRRGGFNDAGADPMLGGMQFWQKTLARRPCAETPTRSTDDARSPEA